MELSLESDADALWQDSLDLLTEEGAPAALLAMLQKCTPVQLEDGVLHVETPMRMVAKSVAKNAAIIEACLAQAAFEPVRLDVQFRQGGAAAPTVAPVQAAPSPAPAPVPTAAASQVAAEPAPQSAPSPEATRFSPAEAPAAPAQPQAERPRGHVLMGAAGSVMTPEELRRWNAAASGSSSASAAPEADGWDEEDEAQAHERLARERRERNPLANEEVAADSKLTFDRFVMGDENEFAYNAALQVANGNKDGYNPLFIYGKSGLGKTHLLRAIQNYIVTNDPSRICVYRDASQFINEYVGAMREAGSAADALRRNYEDVDVLIIDDVQGLAGKAGTITFFFNIFNTLKSNGKQIVIAADRTPAELGMGKDGFDERVTSRIGGGFTISVQVPSYELKLRLIGTFCDRMREDSVREHVGEPLPEIPERLQQLMAERAGTNIRTIEGFCQKCLITAAMRRRQGAEFTEDDVRGIAKESWPENARGVTIENVQKYVEKVYDVSHEDLVGPKRMKEIMMTRHVAIWLCRELCNRTLADIGKKFGGRSHATIKHSIHTVEELAKDDKVFFDQLQRMKEGITSEA